MVFSSPMTGAGIGSPAPVTEGHKENEMSEPVTLYSIDGESVTVYTPSARASRLATGQWFTTAAEAQSKAAPVEEAAAPEEEAPKAKRPAKGKDA